MTVLADSYAHCELVARKSGSSFFRSFSLLERQRRDAMMALYAFARLADDATDPVHPRDTQPLETWPEEAWHEWIDRLTPPFRTQTLSAPSCLPPIQAALSDSVNRFAIPLSCLHDIVRGVGMDVSGAIRFDAWEQTRHYCHLVASSVGVACLSLWANRIGEPPSSEAVQAALDCGVAFQLTNILRDITEDSQRNRVYLPLQDLARFDIDMERWLGMPSHPTVFALNELGDWRGLVRLQIERAKAMYDSGWQVSKAISLDGQRMFSLIWQTYRTLLDRIESDPQAIWRDKVRISKVKKLALVVRHTCTPLFHQSARALDDATRLSPTQTASFDWPSGGPRVAVIGAGLAGINASLHLARHGCRVTLLESKRRIGGRVGSFLDPRTEQSIDYCQHVGMACCSTLVQWISDTEQKPYWTEQDTLHFVSSSGKKIPIGAWPLPAPFHLAGLLLRWPQLSWQERIRVGNGLLRLLRLKRSDAAQSQLAIDWLRKNGQTDRCISNFWATILVSALGDQVDRVTLGATHKVLVDGFAANRRAFHLLVPNRSLSELMEKSVFANLQRWGVSIRCGETVRKIELNCDGSKSLHMSTENSSEAFSNQDRYDAVVCALPWNKIVDVVPAAWKETVEPAGELDASPITGIHTWWDRPWLKEPHAIMIDRLCQWVFPAPTVEFKSDTLGTREHYYQIVVSGSRELPRGDTESLLRLVKQDLAEIFPESAVATMLRGKAVTDPNSVFSVSPGHETSRLKSNLLSRDQIWLAGDWIETGWPATMEGALRSGLFAAEGVLSQFGRMARLIDRD